MNCLIIKTGALGDVVRTQYFAKYILEQKSYKVHWFTSPESEIILKGNQFIEAIYTEFSEFKNKHWDVIYSLEDDLETLSKVTSLKFEKFIGLSICNNKVSYTTDTSLWNDMGIHSSFGIAHANRLKRNNKKSHLEIFSEIFQVSNVNPNWKGIVPSIKIQKKENLIVACNMFAGKRWPNKSASAKTVLNLLKLLENDPKIYEVRLIGTYSDWEPFLNQHNKSNYYPTATIDDLKEVIYNCDYLLTCDSLAVHIAAAVGTPYICFFGPTSADEIKVPNVRYKNIISRAPGYCSYNPNAEITGINEQVIYKTLQSLAIEKR